MGTEDSMRDEHLAIAFEANRQLRAENEALRKDAERYRWVRSAARTDTGEPWIARSFLSGISAWTGEYADEAIDAAMQPIPCTTAEQSKP